MRASLVPTLREQMGIHIMDMRPDYRDAILAVWAEYGIDAARCFALGA